MVAEDSYSEQYQDGAIKMERIRHPMHRFAHPFIEPMRILNFQSQEDIFQQDFNRAMTQFIRPMQPEQSLIDTQSYELFYEESMRQFQYIIQDPYYQESPFYDPRMDVNNVMQEAMSNLWSDFRYSQLWTQIQQKNERTIFLDQKKRKQQRCCFTKNFLPNYQRIFSYYKWEACQNQLKRNDIYFAYLRGKQWKEKYHQGLPIAQKRIKTAGTAPLRHAKMNLKVH